MIFLYILYLLLGLYFIFLVFILIGTFRLRQPEKSSIYNNISVIIAARNEEDNIASLMESLVNQNYPEDKYEIITISDRSTDRTDLILKEYSKKYKNIHYFRIEQEDKNLIGKKNALTKGIENSNGDILLFTDADCLPGKNWIKSINQKFNEDFDAVVGYSPLISDKKRSLWEELIFTLRKLERLSIFVISAGTIGWNWGVTATGRNFGYKRKVFDKLNGFSGIGHIPSGDDDLFLQKISKSKLYKISFAIGQDSFVSSIERKNAKEQYNQEIRRASKWRFYPAKIKIFSALIFIFYLILFVAFILTIFSILSLVNFLFIFIVKILIDFFIVFRGAVLFKEKRLLLVFPLAEVFYIPYFLIFGLLGIMTKYKWRINN
ncbi:MAG: glycosyltransferase [Candidatus Cloacimonetes bacterium]|nr:glycosyltransferase [Candidatus Cloacimonadota bacterium]